MQLHATIRIIVLRHQHFEADLGFHGQLFAELAGHTRSQRFAGIALAARKFPGAREMDTRLAARHQEPPIPLDDRGRDDDRRHWERSGVNGYDRQFFAIGQVRHLGFRATQTMAPKSMSA